MVPGISSFGQMECDQKTGFRFSNKLKQNQMFDKKELIDRINNLEQKLHFIQRDILSLQNPFKFEIGDKVIAETKKGVNLLPSFPIKYDGTVVGIKYEFRRKEPYFINEERVNIYTVFNAASKTTHELSEQWYQIELK